jgi:hypothetical protein
MAVNIEVKEGQELTVEGPARVSVTSDVPGSVLIDGVPIPPPIAPDVAATVTGLSPDTAVAGDAADIEMSVMGDGFTPDSRIVFNGLEEPTTFVSAAQLSTGVKPSLFKVPADCPVSVRTGSAMSNEITFSFTDPAARSSRSRKSHDHDDD